MKRNNRTITRRDSVDFSRQKERKARKESCLQEWKIKADMAACEEIEQGIAQYYAEQSEAVAKLDAEALEAELYYLNCHGQDGNFIYERDLPALLGKVA